MLFDEIILGQLVSEKEIDACIFRVYENRIYHVIIKKGEMVTMEVVKEGYNFLDGNGGGKYFNIFEFHSFSDIDPEVREWAASPSNNTYTHVDALIINSFPQKIIADFYIRYNKPIKPTRVFNSFTKALEWIHGEMKFKT